MSRHTALAVTFLVLGAVTARGSFAEELSKYSGAELYKRFCASCHGESAQGDGPVAPFFKLTPPDLTRIAKRHGGKFPADQVQQIIDGRSNPGAHGTRSMPVWGLEFMQADPKARPETIIERLVEYLRTLQRD
jgi:mono/diheme cytochrome c family protein